MNEIWIHFMNECKHQHIETSEVDKTTNTLHLLHSWTESQAAVGAGVRQLVTVFVYLLLTVCRLVHRIAKCYYRSSVAMPNVIWAMLDRCPTQKNVISVSLCELCFCTDWIYHYYCVVDYPCDCVSWMFLSKKKVCQFYDLNDTVSSFSDAQTLIWLADQLLCCMCFDILWWTNVNLGPGWRSWWDSLMIWCLSQEIEMCKLNHSFQKTS
jgi:hypothetical protein